MTIKNLTALRDAERQADEILAEASKQAVEILVTTEEEIHDLISLAKIATQNKYNSILDKAETQGNTEVKEVAAMTHKQVIQLTESASGKMEAAIEFTLRHVIRSRQ